MLVIDLTAAAQDLKEVGDNLVLENLAVQIILLSFPIMGRESFVLSSEYLTDGIFLIYEISPAMTAARRRMRYQ